MPALKAANLVLKFLLELASLAAFAYWGGTVGKGAVSVVLAIAAPLVAAVLWGVFAAPRSERRLPDAARIPFELAVFALAALALLGSVGSGAAIAFACVAIVNTALLTVFAQWER